jgi:hypothetical protein
VKCELISERYWNVSISPLAYSSNDLILSFELSKGPLSDLSFTFLGSGLDSLTSLTSLGSSVLGSSSLTSCCGPNSFAHSKTSSLGT